MRLRPASRTAQTKEGFTPLEIESPNRQSSGFFQYSKGAKSLTGFTLIELLIVIAIIAVLAAVTFVALDPLRRFQDSRDSRRWTDITELLHAIKVNQVDNGGRFLTSIAANGTAVTGPIATGTSVYMLGTSLTATSYSVLSATGGGSSDCTGATGGTAAIVTGTSAGVTLTGLVPNYLNLVPADPLGTGTWPGTGAGATQNGGYWIRRPSSGIIQLGSCSYEGTTSITISR